MHNVLNSILRKRRSLNLNPGDLTLEYEAKMGDLSLPCLLSTGSNCL